MSKVVRILIIVMLLSSCKTDKKDVSQTLILDDVNSRLINHKTVQIDTCRIVDSIAKTVSSVPYNSFTKTPFDFKVLRVKDSIGSSYFRYTESYPEMDEEGFDNGGQVSLSKILSFEEPKSDTLYINENIKVFVKSDSWSDRKDFFVLSLNQQFENLDLLLFEKIDFKISYGEMSQTPIIFGTYWANLNDIPNKCKWQ